ncbi:hypothetical protein TRIUR3_08160 [Triticum urartu]|uniref:Uncharacterized protein n=1 Tax=Triticum urartu TaxID=4572 RepID=M7Z1U7_TRIUA|nr:hypothetical protein TRIUR3_08160 [Triticum urartu]
MDANKDKANQLISQPLTFARTHARTNFPRHSTQAAAAAAAEMMDKSWLVEE